MCKVAAGLVVPMPIWPAASKTARCEPPVEIANSSAAGRNKPRFWSAVNDKAGLTAVPSDKSNGELMKVFPATSSCPLIWTSSVKVEVPVPATESNWPML